MAAHQDEQTEHMPSTNQDLLQWIFANAPLCTQQALSRRAAIIPAVLTEARYARDCTQGYSLCWALRNEIRAPSGKRFHGWPDRAYQVRLETIAKRRLQNE